jgi:crotonobetainyl-CoA:carnitine CoA-transferase CaiB-like acyl-CoA transferase
MDGILKIFRDHNVAAWPVRGSRELMADSRFRKYFLCEVVHPLYGPTGMYDAVSPIVPDDHDDWQEGSPAPLLGEQSDSILREYAGLSTQEIADLRAAQVI